MEKALRVLNLSEIYHTYMSLIIEGITLAEFKTFLSTEIENCISKVGIPEKNLDSTSLNAKKLFTRKEAAQRLGISLVTLNTWTKDGIINAYRISTRVRYTEQNIQINGKFWIVK